MKTHVLDKGYVRLVNVYGTELDIVNAARLSFDTEHAEFTPEDERLIRFLVKENHRSPFRHVYLSLEFKAPLFVARQHWRHIVGASTLETGTPYSELSRRYVRGKEEFYVPSVWRKAAENKKQGSYGSVNYDTQKYEDALNTAIDTYNDAVDSGVAPEQARAMLPQSLYTKYLWTPSLDATWNFLKLRLAPDTQWETQQYALAVEDFVRRCFPKTYFALEYELYPYLREP